jgi:hypothetical protein
MCGNSQFCASWHNNFSKKSQTGPILGSVWPRIFDVGYADHCLNTTSNLIRSGVHFVLNPGTNWPLIPQSSQSRLITGSVQGTARPCLIINSRSIQLNRGAKERLTKSNPVIGIMENDPKAKEGTGNFVMVR